MYTQLQRQTLNVQPLAPDAGLDQQSASVLNHNLETFKPLNDRSSFYFFLIFFVVVVETFILEQNCVQEAFVRGTATS